MSNDCILVTGGAGYVGAPLVEELLSTGARVRVLDFLGHGQSDVAARLERLGAEVQHGDVRDATARDRALRGASAVVHLAAIVGDPACARDPSGSQQINVDASRDLAFDADSAGIHTFVFASTCSNYGRVHDSTFPIDEDGELRPLSLYAQQKVEVERMLLGQAFRAIRPICLRLATVFGSAPRMRFDLTVNEFTRDLWAGVRLKVFGEYFWRPYVHVRDVGRAVRLIFERIDRASSVRVFNVGSTSENYRKLDLVNEIRRQLGRGDVEFVRVDDDPRDYKVSFERIRHELGFEIARTVPEGVEELRSALEAGLFGDPFDPRHRNTP